MPYDPDFEDFGVFDCVITANYNRASDSANVSIRMIKRPMTYSAAVRRDEIVAFDPDDCSLHVPDSDLAALPSWTTVTIGDTITIPSMAMTFNVIAFELQTDQNRWHIIGRLLPAIP